MLLQGLRLGDDKDQALREFFQTLVDQYGTGEEKSVYFSGKFGRAFTNLQGGSIYH